MAVLGKFDDADVTVNAVDLSQYVRSVTININASEEEISAMGDAWAEFTIGRKEWDISIDFWQAFYTAEVDATLNSLVGAAATTVEVLPDGTGASTSNPSYTGSAFCTGYSPMDGQYDQNLSTTATFKGTGTLTRATA